jgi:Zn-finger nucleic acid-binding protein
MVISFDKCIKCGAVNRYLEQGNQSNECVAEIASFMGWGANDKLVEVSWDEEMKEEPKLDVETLWKCPDCKVQNKFEMKCPNCRKDLLYFERRGISIDAMLVT